MLKSDTLAAMKKDRIQIAEILLNVAARVHSELIPRDYAEAMSRNEAAASVKNASDRGPPLNIMRSFAEDNLDSGGPEVLELLANVKASPRTLKSCC